MDSKEALIRQLVVSTVMVVVMMVCFFISAGRMDIYRAWLFFGATFIYMTLSTITLYRYNPELLIQRLIISREGSKMWDEVLMRLSNLTVMLAIPAAAGVDVGRFIWSELGWPDAVLGYALFVFSSVLITWSMVVNRHFEPTVRIQHDREHKVITAGPYGWVRHPGYLAGILLAWSMPLALGSLFAFLPVAAYTFFMMLRTYLEDRTLMEELEGYTEYSEKTRHRLFPIIW